MSGTDTRSVVVTGATSGIGRATALRLARTGYDVIGTARNPDKADALRTAAAEQGVHLRTVLLNVADQTSCMTAFAEIAELTGGGPWALVNNAGIPAAGAVEDVTTEDARHLLEINLLAPARTAALVLPAMRRRGNGRIVNVSSIGGRLSIPFNGWYCASKAALTMLTDTLRLEAARDGIHVVAIEPGGYASDIWKRGDEGLAGHPAESAYADAYPTARAALRTSADRFPGPEPVAHAIHQALTARRPRPHYVVGAQAHAASVLLPLCPRSALDRIKRLIAGLSPPGGLLDHAVQRAVRSLL
jgi:NAD(P)-dependent dehydrogenase (short-subunit alcohol dehydrogenase family)